MNKQQLETLVKKLGFNNTESQNNDSKDFKEVAIWQITEALQEAYELGKNSQK